MPSTALALFLILLQKMWSRIVQTAFLVKMGLSQVLLLDMELPKKCLLQN